MKIYKYSDLDEVKLNSLLRRQSQDDPKLKEIVTNIINEVKDKGDEALIALTQKFDCPEVNLSNLKVSQQEIDEAFDSLDSNLKEALQKAAKNIRNFHAAQLKVKDAEIEQNAVKLWREFRPIERIGLYVPGGKATYPSTVLMLGVPAKVAGCKNIVMCTPVNKDGKCNSNVLAAAKIAGISEIYKVGGAQAIAAMAYGTGTIPKVYKILGPGNSFVTEAKTQVSQIVAIDMPAGPSECLIIADEKQNPSWIAADLNSQLEHGEDSQCVLLTLSEDFANQVVNEMQKQIDLMPRKEIMRKSFDISLAFVVNDLDQASLIANMYAPEHLEIVLENENLEQQVLKQINNAGSVFLGKYSSEPLGDYATGTNHTLPTSGFAKMFSGLSMDSFGKMMTVQRVSKEGIENLRNIVKVIGTSEGLDAHVNSVEVRFKSP